MKKLDTTEKKQDAIMSFINLLNHEGWKLVVEILDDNINLLRDQLESGTEKEKLSDVERIRDKLKLLKEMRDTPQTMIKKLEVSGTEPTRLDPFDTLEDVKTRKKAELDTDEEE